MHIIGWIIAGLIIGAIARLLIPGPQPMGIIVTILLGIAGSFAGGAIANLVQGGSITEPRAAGWIGSIFGAMLILFIYSRMRSRTP